MAPHRRLEIALSASELEALLDECRTLHVATINADGTPHLVPVYYIVIDGVVTFWTYAKSQKVVNLRRDPRITCLVETSSGTHDARGAQLAARAEIVADAAVVSAVGAALHARHVGPVDAAYREELPRRAAKRVVVRVHPHRVVSWDHRKLGAPRGSTAP